MITRILGTGAALGFVLAAGIAQAQSQTSGIDSEGFFASDEMRSVMSFNLRYDGDSGERAWENRRAHVLEVIDRYRPVFLGTQEGLINQIQDLEAGLEGYDFIGVSRQGNEEDEFSALFYDTTHATLADSGNFWLSDTPDVAGSMMQGTGHPRMASWGAFDVDGNPVWVFNTHVEFAKEFNEPQVRVLLDEIAERVPDDAEVFITGDFNVPRMTNVWKLMSDAGFSDAWQLAEHHTGPDFSIHSFRGTEAPRKNEVIDWIFHRSPAGVTLEKEMLASIVTDHTEGVWPSDHFPVVLTTLGEPQIEVQNLSLGSTNVQADEPLAITATAMNKGQRGVAAVGLYLDREKIGEKWTVFDLDESREVTFEQRLYEPGPHGVSVELSTPEMVNVEAVPATLSIVDFNLTPYVRPGEPASAKAIIRNSGSFNGSMTANFFVSKVLADSTQVTVAPGEEVEVGFAHTFDVPGTAALAIGNHDADVSASAELTEPWLFSRGDDMAWAETGFDDSDWQTVELPRGWELTSDYTENNVYGWYRTTFTVPADWEGRPVRILLGQIDDADKTYVNGELIGETGRFPDDEGGYQGYWNKQRAYTLHPDLIQYGGENTVAVRVFDALGGGGIHRGTLGLLPL